MLKKGDKIIYNSDFGYELGYYENISGFMYGTCLVNLVTGQYVNGEFSAEHRKITKYSTDALKQMVDRYNYVKIFPNK